MRAFGCVSEGSEFDPGLRFFPSGSKQLVSLASFDFFIVLMGLSLMHQFKQIITE